MMNMNENSMVQLELRIPSTEEDYRAYLQWKKQQEDQDSENNEYDQRIIIIEI